MKRPKNTQVAERIKEIRRKKNLTQIGLAALLGMSQGAVKSFETSRTEPNIGILCRLADIGEVTVDWILGRKPKDEKRDGAYLRQLCEVFLSHDMRNTKLSDHLEREMIILLELMGQIENNRH